MKRSTGLKRFGAALILGCGFIAPAASAGSVLELFTSHGCSSCPPAEALFNELIERDDSLIALEYHVDYWNSLIHGSAGNWVDPFSKPAFSFRQRAYNSAGLDGRNGVYTPQAVVNGRYAAVGSDYKRVTGALETKLPETVEVSVEQRDDVYQISVKNTTASTQTSEARVWLVRYIKSAETEITAGENKGRRVENHHVVTSMEQLGRVPQEDSIVLSAGVDADPNTGCAVLIQNDFHSPILAATRCPG